jgi:FkbM family methyltransferase
MDLYNHPNPAFTKWVVAERLLRELFVVIDVGCQGGGHPRWKHLGDLVDFYGFDAISEVVEGLKRENAGRKNRSYFNIGLGNEDGRRQFFVHADAFSSSFYGAGDGAEGNTSGIVRGSREVDIRKLDTLFAEKRIPAADYIKLDCEGFEPEILTGARSYLAKSGTLCVTAETNFGTSPVYLRTHFQAINEILVEHRLLVFDLNFVHTPRATYTAALAKRPQATVDPMTDMPPLVVGQPTTFDFVFCRDFVAEKDHPHHFFDLRSAESEPSVDKIIKAMINFELHGLMDCAVDLAVRFREKLKERLDVDEAVELLLAPAPYPRNTADVVSCLTMITQLRNQVNELREKSQRPGEQNSLKRLLRSWRMALTRST